MKVKGGADALSHRRTVQDKLRGRSGAVSGPAGCRSAGHHPAVCLGDLSADGERVHLSDAADPDPDLFAGRLGPEHPDGLCRAAVAGHGCLHGGRGLCLLQDDHPHAVDEPDCGDPAVGLFQCRCGCDVRHPQLADQGVLSGHRDTGGAVLSGLAVREMGLAVQLQRFGRDPGAEPGHLWPVCVRPSGGSRLCNTMWCCSS